MGLPVIIGVSSIFGGAISYITSALTTNIAKKAMNLALFSILMALFYAAVSALGSTLTDFLSSLDMSMPASFGNWINFMIPSNFSYCMTALLSFEVGAITYKLAIKVINYKARMIN